MWLLSVDTFQLQYFPSPPARYAILSHTWGDDEVEFQDMVNIPRAKRKGGWGKIQLVCDEARRHSLPYAWVDSCCIDKKSSAELSEAINSMFEWYRQARFCVAYLSDLQTGPRQQNATGSRVSRKQLERCRWFTRGWTLQELIAPAHVNFFNYAGDFVGTKDDLLEELAEITGIDHEVLQHVEFAFGVAVGRRMSWAARRETTRIEDLAYCLFGLFNVNLPLLYGEGEKAFLRLQEVIARQEQDLSLFAWEQQSLFPQYRGILAQSPAEFINCSELVCRDTSVLQKTKFTVTDHGLMVYVDVDPTRPMQPRDQRDIYLNLDCFRTPKIGPKLQRPENLMVSLRKVGDSHVRVVSPWISETVQTLRPALGGRPQNQDNAIVLIKSTSRSYSDFLEIVLERKLVLIYRERLARVLYQVNSKHPSEHCRPKLGGVEELCQENGVEYTTLDIMHLYRVSDKVSCGEQPLWWECFVLSPSRWKVINCVVICGMPIKHRAPSEHLLPWVALFSTERSRGRELYDMVALLLETQASRPPSLDVQHLVGDCMFNHYADRSGNISQERLPTVVKAREGDMDHVIRVQRRGGQPSTFLVELQYELTEFDRDWKPM